MQATVLLALLQPAPETYELFDDVLLLSEGNPLFRASASNYSVCHSALC